MDEMRGVGGFREERGGGGNWWGGGAGKRRFVMVDVRVHTMAWECENLKDP